MKTIRFAAALAMATVFCTTPGDGAERRSPLFNGRNLDGWKLLTCEAKADANSILITAGNGLVETTAKFTDFILEFDWHPLAEDKWDSGVYFRYDEIPEGKPWPKRYQVNLRKGEEGNVGGLTGAKSEGLIRPKTWNHFRLTIKGPNAELMINGQDAWKAEGLEVRESPIALQAEVPGGGQHRFRNIVVTQLK